MTDLNWRQLDIRLYAVLASLMISAIILAFPEAHTPNDDSYKYIRTAEIFLDQGVSAAFQHYSWASYAVVVGLTSKLGIDLFTAAHLINTLLFAVLTFAFVSIVREINPERAVLIFATIVILVYPQLNEYRRYIIRDIGFWAFALLALWQLLVYSKSGLMRHASGFCASMLLATALRPEALIYLVITPFSLFFVSTTERSTYAPYFYRLIALVAGIGVIAVVALALLGVNIIALFLEFVSVYKPFFVNTFSPDPAQANAIGSAIFGEYAAGFSKEYLTLFIVTGLFSVLIANLFSGVGGPYFLALLYGFWHKQLRWPRRFAVPILSFMLTNLVILLCFLFITRYLTSRYTVLFALMLALLIPALLARYWQDHGATKARLARNLIILFITYCAFDAYISFGDSKQYVYRAIEWVQENTDESNSLVTNNQAVAYFSGKIAEYDTVDSQITADEILRTDEGDVVVLELHYVVEQLLLLPEISTSFEQILVLPDASDRQLVILRRTGPR